MDVNKFVKELTNNGLGPFMGVPCSVFKYLIRYLDDSKDIESYICSSEGEAIGLAGGFALSKRIPVIYMQNDGYGNAVNPLSSLQLMYKLKALLLISWRGKPGVKSSPQHQLMGKTIRKLLEIFNIPYIILKDNTEDLEKSIAIAKDYFNKNKTPFAFIVNKGLYEQYGGNSKESKLNIRLDYIKILSRYINDSDILLGATGYSGREIYQTVDHARKFYMMGSMGCLPSIGLGLAIENPKNDVFVVDGDGSLLMKMGSLSTIGYYSPKNLVHICFDNNQYESTGGQNTTSNKTDFLEVAKASNYKSVYSFKDPSRFRKFIRNINGIDKPAFCHIKVSNGTIDNLKRPSLTPEEMKTKLMENL